LEEDEEGARVFDSNTSELGLGHIWDPLSYGNNFSEEVDLPAIPEKYRNSENFDILYSIQIHLYFVHT